MIPIRKPAPIHLVVQQPQTEAGKKALAQRISEIHAAAVNQRLTSLNCPTEQKRKLLEAVMETAGTKNREQSF
ncbi:MAG: hypothetical protein IJN20_00940 [Oscillospiraceae bacterium]|nr:hypothetical protein [Oscillospiraceae bacterium]